MTKQRGAHIALIKCGACGYLEKPNISNLGGGSVEHKCRGCGAERTYEPNAIINATVGDGDIILIDCPGCEYFADPRGFLDEGGLLTEGYKNGFAHCKICKTNFTVDSKHIFHALKSSHPHE